MTSLRFEDVIPQAAYFVRSVRSRSPQDVTESLSRSVRAAADRTIDRAALCDAVAERLRALDAPEASLVAAERLRTRGTVCVVAGQQPVLFGGPHLVVSKALTAVAAARAIDRAGGSAVPVFWNASEDHDHAEVDHVTTLRGDGSLERLVVTLAADRSMLSRTPLDARDAYERLVAGLPAGPGADDAARAARPVEGDDVGTAFSRVVLRLLGRFGLVVVEPATLRQFARAVVRHELEFPGALADAIRASEARVEAQGFARPLDLRRRELYFLVDRKGRRHRPPQGDERSRASLLARLESDPAAFSWDVAGRVLAQDVALPVAAQVCGPAEFAYCDVIASAHALLGVPAPMLLPRPGVTFVEREAAEACAAAGVRPADVVTGAAETAHPGAASLRPGGALQERTLSILPFVARHGSGILDRVLAAFAGRDAEHVLIAAGDEDAQTQRPPAGSVS